MHFGFISHWHTTNSTSISANDPIQIPNTYFSKFAHISTSSTLLHTLFLLHSFHRCAELKPFEVQAKFNVAAGSWTKDQALYKLYIQFSNRSHSRSRRKLTLKAWLTAESSMGQSILPFTLTVPTKKSCCLTSWLVQRGQQTGDTRSFNQVGLLWRGRDDMQQTYIFEDV